MIDIAALSQEMLSAYTSGAAIAPLPSERGGAFDMNAAYAVEAGFARLRQQSGRRTMGLKVGYATKAVWRKLKLETLVWAHMYDDTVHDVTGGTAEIALPYYRAARIEPEVVFCVKEPLAAGLDAEGVLRGTDWMATGFEMIDSPYPESRFTPADFVAAFGLHMGLAVGPRLRIDPEMIPALANGLAEFKVRVSKNGEFLEEGAGRNVLRSPALCMAELAGAVTRQPDAAPLGPGEIITTGALTGGHPSNRGETWRVDVEGLPLAGLTVTLR